jgi:hypothetical protein
MHGTGPSKRHEGELARVQSAFNTDHAQGARHLGVGNLNDPKGGRQLVHSRSFADASQGFG